MSAIINTLVGSESSFQFMSSDSIVNQKENVVIAATITEDGQYINANALNMKAEEFKIFSTPEALIWAFEEITRKAAEVELAIQEDKANKEAIIQAVMRQKQFQAMLRDFRNNKDSVFTGPSLGCDKTLRRMLNIQFRKEMKEFKASLKGDNRARDLFVKGQIAITNQALAIKEKAIQERKAQEKEERQAAHQRKENKMRARKIEGKTPKQITRKRKNAVAKVQVKKAQTFAWVKAIVAVHTEQVRQGKLSQRKANQKEAILMRSDWNYKAAFTVEDTNARQGARMKMLVSALMNNKEA